MIEEEVTLAAAVEGAEPAPVRTRRTTRKTAAADNQSQEGADEPAGDAPKRAARSRKAQTVPEGDAGVDAEQASVKRSARAKRAAAAKESAPKRRARKTAVKQGSEPAEGQESAPASGKTEPASGKTEPADGTVREQEAEEARAAAPRRKTRVRPATDEVAPDEGGKGSGKGNHQNKKQRSTHNDNQNNHRHQRSRRNNGQREVQPSVTMEDLAKCKVAELRAKAAELGVDAASLKKAELVTAVYEASIKAEGFIEVVGVLDILTDGYGFLRTQGYLPSESDCYVSLAMIRRNGLRKGDMVRGQTRPARENEKYAAIQKIISVNDVPVDQLAHRVKFSDLTPIYPDECLRMEHGKSAITARVIDLVSPIGKGQRGLIVSPPKAGKTTILKDVAAAISANNPEVHLMCLLVDERPEEVTDMQRSIKGEVVSSTFDMPTENHIAVSELVIERAKRLVECGKDVVILLDSITRLARAYNLAQPASGRILSGGVDSTALYPPKRFLGAARNIENGGSLTILASALIDTGSKMDEVIFEEFKGTGNMELKLDRNLADRRIFPAIDPVASGTRKEDLLLDPQQAPLIWAVRRILANLNNTERAMDMLIKSLKQTDTNTEFLLRTAKKAQHTKMDQATEL